MLFSDQRLYVVTCLLLLLTHPTAVAADDHGVVFLYPTRGLTFYYLDVVNVTYTSSFSTPNLYTFCDGGKQVGVQPAAPLNGTTMVSLNFTSDTSCWFDLRPGTEAGYGANSPPFTLVNTKRLASADTTSSTVIPTTTSISVSSTPVSASATSPPADPTHTSAAPTTAGNPAKSEGIGSGAIAGIAVGVSAAVLAGLGVVWFLYRRRRNVWDDDAMAGPGYDPKHLGALGPDVDNSEGASEVVPVHAHQQGAQQGVQPGKYTEHRGYYGPNEVGEENLPAELPLNEFGRDRPELEG